MNKIILSAAAAILLAGSGAALAQESTNSNATSTTGTNMSGEALDFVALDADANGMLSLQEAQVAWPDLTQQQFEAADTDHDGSLSEDEANALKATAGVQNSTVESTDQTDKTDDNQD
jgi:hypothetical protein